MKKFFFISSIVSFPETILTLLFGLKLCNVKKISFKKILCIAFLQSLIAFLIRIFNIGAGIHTFLQIISLSFLVIMALNGSIYGSITIVLIGSLLQGILQNIIVQIMSGFEIINLANLINEPRSILICWVPVFLLSLLILFIINKTGYILWDVNINNGDENV